VPSLATRVYMNPDEAKQHVVPDPNITLCDMEDASYVPQSTLQVLQGKGDVCCKL